MSDFGGKLRQAREGRGISLRQIAANTKIAVAVLEALERNDVSKLPGGIFSRAFVRSYAVEVGLDPDETVREFLERFHGEPAPEHTLHVPVSEQEDALARHGAVMLGVKVVAAVLLVSAIAAYFFWKGRRTPEDAARAPQQQVQGQAPVQPAAQSPPVVPPPTTTPAPLPTSGPMRLEIRPVGECWVRLSIDGKPVLGRVMQAGEVQTFIVQQVADVDVGDAAAFGFSVDGRPGKPLGGAKEVKSAHLTRQTLAQYLR
jgi:cytoskeleton protein RodZ